ncbi:MAG: hypothetical protein QW279_01770 [Candidatus Jordarchaeaceae archaeon]
MKTVQQRAIEKSMWHCYLFLVMGGGSALGLNYVFMFTIVHEFLHAIPLSLSGIPFILGSTFCMSPYLLALLRGVAGLSCIFPYLAGYIATFAPVPYMVFRRRLSPFWLEFVIVSFVLTLMCHIIHLPAEFLIVPL